MKMTTEEMVPVRLQAEQTLSPQRREDVVRAWQNLPGERLVDYVGDHDLATAQALQQEVGKRSLYRERERELQPQRPPCSESKKQLIHLACVGVGALSMMGLGTVMSPRWGPLTIPASLIFGAFVTAAADHSAKNVMANARLCHESHIALRDRQQLCSAAEATGNILEQQYHQARVEALATMEAEALKPALVRDAVLAGGAFVGESAISWVLLGLAGFPGGFGLAALATLLPLVVNGLGAAIQADLFELPERREALRERYAREIEG